METRRATLRSDEGRVGWRCLSLSSLEHQHFTLTEPEGGWYVERYDRVGTSAKTAWRREVGDAQDLVAATIRRGEIAHVMPPHDAPEEHLARLKGLGRVELV